MNYTLSLFLIGLVLGLVGAASNPAPFYAALGLVLAAGAGCAVLVGHGGSFLSLILFLIYLGGMVVVFAYSTALAAEPFPKTWGDQYVFMHVAAYFAVLAVLTAVSWSHLHEDSWFVADGLDELAVVRANTAGVATIYASGSGMLMVSGWVLLLTLFVVLDLARGSVRGALRPL